jgi:hypothetical protein
MRMWEFFVYTSSRRIQRLEREVESIEQEPTLEDLRPGSLSKQYNVCGVEACRCRASPPRKHGPDYQLSLAHQGEESFSRRSSRQACDRLAPRTSCSISCLPGIKEER